MLTLEVSVVQERGMQDLVKEGVKFGINASNVAVKMSN
jgi:hypothetical protein